MPTLLIVDDEPNLLYSLKKGLETDQLRVVTAETAEAGIEAVRMHSPDAVILDVRLPDMSGLDAFAEMRQFDARIPVILITAYSTTETAIEAMKLGAYDYLLKPVEFDKLNDVVERALEISRMSRVPATFADESDDPNADHIVGHSPKMQDVYKAIGRVAIQDVNVLIVGESGTGKEMVARAILHHSRRSKGPFLAINCAALPEPLLESELFGHERGSFTGADKRHIGKFEQINGGTIFLDEIGDMTSATQAKVLRLLQDGTFERVGSSETIRVDVRVIAATNKDLEAMVEEGDFRQDLYYRLKVFTIELPSLRERTDDIPLLVEHFIRLFNRDFGKNVRSIEPQAMRTLEQYEWPGNIRELQSAMKHALVRSVGPVLTVDFLPASCRGLVQAPTTALRRRWRLRTFDDSFTGCCRKTIRISITNYTAKSTASCFRKCSAMSAATRRKPASFWGSRSTLRNKITDLGLTFEKRLKADSGRDH